GGYIINGASYGIEADLNVASLRIKISDVTFDKNRYQHIRISDAASVYLSDNSFLDSLDPVFLSGVTTAWLFMNSSLAASSSATGAIQMYRFGNSFDAGTFPTGIDAAVPSGPIAPAKLTIGSGSALTRAAKYTVRLSPSAVAANTCAEQTFPVAG